MKLGIVSDEIDRDFATAVEVGLAAGIRHYEVRSTQSGRLPNVPDEEIEAIVGICESRGVTVTGISPGLFKGTIDDDKWERQLSEDLGAAFRQADRLGTDKLIIFAFHKPGVTTRDPMSVVGADYPEAILPPLQEAARRAEEAGKLLLIENEHVCWGDTGDTTAEIIRRVASPAMRLNWDPGNSAASDAIPFPDEYQRVKDLIANVHLKNRVPDDGHGRWSQLAEGIVDWEGQLKALARDGYDGVLTLENHAKEPPDITARNAAFVRNALSGYVLD